MHSIWPENVSYTLRRSPDQSKLLLFMSWFEPQGTKKTVYSSVFSASMDPLWNGSVDLELSTDDIADLEPIIDNDGVVYCVSQGSPGVNYSYYKGDEPVTVHRITADGARSVALTAAAGSILQAVGIAIHGKELVAAGFTDPKAKSARVSGWVLWTMGTDLSNVVRLEGALTTPVKDSMTKTRTLFDGSRVYVIGQGPVQEVSILALEADGTKAWESSAALASRWAVKDPMQARILANGLVLLYYDFHVNIERVNEGKSLLLTGNDLEPIFCTFGADGKMTATPAIPDWSGELNFLKFGPNASNSWEEEGVFLERSLVKGHKGLVLVEWK